MPPRVPEKLPVTERLVPLRRAVSVPDLVATVARSVAAGLLFLGAALVCRRAGVLDQWPPYAVMAATVLPQLATALLAIVLSVVRHRVRITSQGTELGFAVVAVALTTMTVCAGTAHGWSAPVTLAAALAALACCVSAAPPRLELVRHRPDDAD